MADLDVHDVFCADLVEAYLQPIRLALYDWRVPALLCLLEGKWWALEVRRELRSIAIL